MADVNLTVCASPGRCAEAPSFANGTWPQGLLWNEHGDRWRVCRNCTRSRATVGLRPCSQSEQRQEAFVWSLAASLGVETGGIFVELGGNDGRTSSNTLFLETCAGWRGVLIEANPIAFAKLRLRRPAAVAVQAAACASGSDKATLVVRSSRGARRRGRLIGTADVAAGIETLVPRLGHEWLRARHAEVVVRYHVPCVQLGELFSALRVPRVDVFWLDCEGCELAALQSLLSRPPSIGILVVEMRAGDAATNLPLLAALRAGGFELVRSLRVWASHSDRGPVFLMDSVYLRVEHFVSSGGLPAAALGFLLSQSTQARFGINMRRRPGRHGGNYSVEEPEALFARLPQADSTYARKVFS